MATGYFPITCRRGADLAYTIDLVGSDDAPLDLTGYAAALEVRRSVRPESSPGAVLLSLSSAGQSPKLFVNEVPGRVRIAVPGAALLALAAGQPAVWDVAVHNATTGHRFVPLGGPWHTEERVTQWPS
jgi:hypothetical protein